jgi:alkanesulfonate monooxygenase SsuD/methylene tetrahydromethanopterin reductase-like flavin-dependent oxidoreductase (luciferase family)
MRAPTWAAPIEELYEAAIDMAAWAELNGALITVLSEHHATEDRHLPSPLVLAAAMASRTNSIGIMVAAAVVPFYETVRLAEDMAVLDVISRGRVSYVLGVGHREEEYQHFRLPLSGRGARVDEQLRLLIDLLAGNEVTTGGRRSRLSPSPAPGRPQLFIGGGTPAAARRAGRFGLGLIAQAPTPGLVDAYLKACRAAGHEPGFVQIPEPGLTTVLFVADNIERAWSELGRHLLHDATTAASYRHGQTGVASISTATTVDELRQTTTYRIVSEDEAVELVRAGTLLPLAPLCGGIAPEVAWPYLRRAALAVKRANA